MGKALGDCSQRLGQQTNRGGFRLYAVQFETWEQRLELGMHGLEGQLNVHSPGKLPNEATGTARQVGLEEAGRC